MTVNYTSLLSLGQPVTGTESGTWGDDVNNAVTSYLDIAIAGTLTLTGDGAVTLANTQGTSSATNIGSTTAQYYVLKIVGPLSATKVITAPSLSKSYIVINTDATYGVTVKASGQTGVTVPANSRGLVVFNGTDYASVTSGGAGVFTTITASGQITGANSSAAAPAYSFSSYTDAGLYASADVTGPPGANQVSISAIGSNVFTFKSDRATMASAYHQTGTITATGTTPTLASGTYAPTITAVSVCTVTSPGNGQWMRVGNVVTVSGRCTINVTSTLSTLAFNVSLPISSTFTQNYQGAGIARGGLPGSPIAVGLALTTSADVQFSGSPTTTGSVDMYFHFTYLVV